MAAEGAIVSDCLLDAAKGLRSLQATKAQAVAH